MVVLIAAAPAHLACFLKRFVRCLCLLRKQIIKEVILKFKRPRRRTIKNIDIITKIISGRRKEFIVLTIKLIASRLHKGSVIKKLKSNQC